MRTLEGQGLNCKAKTTATHCAAAVDETAEYAQDGTQLVERNGLFDVYYSMLYLLRLAKIEPDEKSERRSQAAGSSGNGAPKRGQIVEALYELFANKADIEKTIGDINNYLDNVLKRLEKAEIDALWNKVLEVVRLNDQYYSGDTVPDCNKKLSVLISDANNRITNLSNKTTDLTTRMQSAEETLAKLSTHLPLVINVPTGASSTKIELTTIEYGYYVFKYKPTAAYNGYYTVCFSLSAESDDDQKFNVGVNQISLDVIKPVGPSRTATLYISSSGSTSTYSLYKTLYPME